MPEYSIFQPGEQAVTISLGNTIEPAAHQKVMAMQQWLQLHPFAGMLDIVVSYSSLTVLYDLYALKSELQSDSASSFVGELLQQAYTNSSSVLFRKVPRKKIPVCYEYSFAPDLSFVSASKNIPVEKIIELHASAIYKVYMIGFLPGFAYMGKLPEQLIMPRKEKPRQRIAKGSVGIAGVQTGIYPVVSPGGWQIIGRTPVTMFDIDADTPVFLEPGDEVQFFPITMEEFNQLDHAAT